VRFAPGDVVVERGIFFGSVVWAKPARVVSHDDGVLATFNPIGIEFFGVIAKSRETAYEELGRGEVTFGRRTWVDHSVLTLVREGDPYQIMGFWNAEGRFVAWYGNLQDPLRWTPFGYDTRDHALDVVIGEDLASWMWKDEHELEMSVQMGLYTPAEAVDIRRAGEDVIAMVEQRKTWWDDWRSFAPDPSWPLPVFPEGWDVV
jgi:hypothetical protein